MAEIDAYLVTMETSGRLTLVWYLTFLQKPEPTTDVFMLTVAD